MAELSIGDAAAHELDAVVALLTLGFPGAHKFSRPFLNWQYYDNPLGAPLGCNISRDAQLIGHLMGIPLEVKLRGVVRRVTLIMNIAVHPAHRGAGLIKRLTEHVIALSAARGHAGVIGVANQNSVAAFEHKLGFQNIAALDAHIECLPHRIDMPAALHDAQFVHRWSDATLAWRMRNPVNPLRVTAATHDSLIVEGASSLPLLRARAVIPRAELSLRVSSWTLPRPAVVIGLAPRLRLQRRLAVTIPARLRPSPLRLIYFDIEDRAARLDPDAVLFNFLDFDAF